MPIVTGTNRYKRPPRKRKPVEIEGPRIVTASRSEEKPPPDEEGGVV